MASDFDSWLDRMVNLAGDVGEKKRKAFYGAKKDELDKQYGTSATPFGPGFEERKLANTGALDVQKLQNAGSSDVARITGAAHTAGIGMELDVAKPRIEAANKAIAREERGNQVAKNIDVDTNRQQSKNILDVMSRSTKASSIMEEHQPNWLERRSNLLSWVSPIQGAIPQMSRMQSVFDKEGLSKKDILTDEQWQGAMGSLNKLKQDRKKLNAF